MKRATFLLGIAMSLIFFAVNVSATLQSPEILVLDGKPEELKTYPLSIWLAAHPGAVPESDVQSTALWRGYLGTWAIVDRKLWLRKVEVTFVDGSEEVVVTPLEQDEAGNFQPGKSHPEVVERYAARNVIDQMFPGTQPVFADWFTGTLIVSRSDMGEDAPKSHDSSYESYTVISIHDGLLIAQHEFDATDYRRFRSEQFERFKATESYQKQFGASLEENGPEDAEEFLFDFAADEYLLRSFE